MRRKDAKKKKDKIMKNNETLTVCSYCRKTLIAGIWVYFYSRMIRSKSNVSHGICPKCMEKALFEVDNIAVE
jgi:hypothetical protein